MILSQISQALSTHLIEIRYSAAKHMSSPKSQLGTWFYTSMYIIIDIHRDNRKIVTKNQNIVT